MSDVLLGCYKREHTDAEWHQVAHLPDNQADWLMTGVLILERT